MKSINCSVICYKSLKIEISAKISENILKIDVNVSKI